MPSSITIVEQVAARQQVVTAQASPETLQILQIFDDEQTGLDASGIPADVIEVGTEMPDGDLLDVSGEPTSLATLRHGKPAVIVFYRGAWCPYCNLALKTYEQQLAAELADQGVALIAVSPQRPDGSLTAQKQNNLSFAVASDPGNQIAGSLGIVTAPTEESRGGQAMVGLDLATANADGTYAIPMPTVVIVDGSGTIRWVDVHPNYTTRSEPAEIPRRSVTSRPDRRPASPNCQSGGQIIPR